MGAGTQENAAAEGSCRRLRAPFWGVGCAWAAFLCAVRFTDLGGVALPVALLSDVTAMALGAAVAAAAMVAGAVRGRIGAGFAMPSRGLLVGSGGAAAVGSIGLFGWYDGFAAVPASAALALCVLFGAALMLVAIGWGSLYAHLEPEQLLPNGAVALVIASLCHAAHEAAGFGTAAWLIVVVLIVASTGCALAAQKRVSPIVPVDNEVTRDGGRTVLRALRVLWMPLAGACLSCFIFGLTWDPIVSSEQDMRVAHQVWGAMVAGPLIMGLAVAAVSARSRGTSPLRLFDQTVYPVAVMLLLVIPVINQAFPDLRFAGNILSSGSFAVVALCMWSNMAAAVRTVPIAPRLVFSAAFVLFALCFVAGLQSIAVVGTDGRTLCLVMFAVYLGLMAVSFALDNREEKASLVPERAADDTRSYIHRRCDEIAQSGGLSPREIDVLYYLARGYNHAYIAKKLYISENTVRTHVRHIYGKLNLSSREDLIDLVDGA
ncbi:LuxR C-terminal-related transcriptional regulator [Adlercreutzia sp. R7]|uniref:LuxR C-terminal-related transcriptional regulator n=1 Tax=Adlercreutzia wanghongyangiae TaxID=3111451 RepID=A0ABU6IHH9_9ACTN|nr:LuxR C-terminal-related transcriptional regulator [Adlercreutzia sp. R7]